MCKLYDRTVELGIDLDAISDQVLLLHENTRMVIAESPLDEEGEPRIYDLFRKEDEDISDFIRRIFSRRRNRKK